MSKLVAPYLLVSDAVNKQSIDITCDFITNILDYLVLHRLKDLENEPLPLRTMDGEVVERVIDNVYVVDHLVYRHPYDFQNGELWITGSRLIYMPYELASDRNGGKCLQIHLRLVSEWEEESSKESQSQKRIIYFVQFKNSRRLHFGFPLYTPGPVLQSFKDAMDYTATHTPVFHRYNFDYIYPITKAKLLSSSGSGSGPISGPGSGPGTKLNSIIFQLGPKPEGQTTDTGTDTGSQYLDPQASIQSSSSAWRLINPIITGLSSGSDVAIVTGDHIKSVPFIQSMIRIMIEPETRTIKGFLDLLRTEWLSHHGAAWTCSMEDLFLPFLNIIWQLALEFPTAFEIHEYHLLLVMDYFGALQPDALTHDMLVKACPKFNLYRSAPHPEPLQPSGHYSTSKWSTRLNRYDQRSLTSTKPDQPRLDLVDESIYFLSPTVVCFHNLVNVSLRENYLKTVPLALANLKQLQSLSLQKNQINGLSDNSVHYFPASLTFLDLSYNNLTHIPCAALSNHLSMLKSLDVAYNSSLFSLVIEAPQVVAGPEGMNHGTMFPKLEQLTITKCTNLEKLVIQCPLPSLKVLYASEVSMNKMTSIVLPHLPLLSKLDISNNRLETLPFDLAQFPQLKELFMSDNCLSELPSTIGLLPELTRLNIRRNKISVLPIIMSRLDNLIALELDYNPITTPPREIVHQGARATVEYLRDLVKGNERLYKMKLLVVGQENVGKTTLLKVLRNKKAAKEISSQMNVSTDGITVDQWRLNKSMNIKEKMLSMVKTSASKGDGAGNDDAPPEAITLTTLDFAGQEIYYSTHQFFLSERSIYLLLWDASKPAEESRVDFWLQSIRTHAPKSPVVIVGTHLDSLSESKAKAIKQQMETKYISTSSKCSVKAVALVSCRSGKGVGSLSSFIEELAMAQPTMGEQFPTTYLKLEKLLLEERSKRAIPTMPWSEVVRLGTLACIADSKELDRAVSFLHLMGAIVHFPKENILKDMLILDPQWITNLLATIVTSKCSFANNGIIQHKDLAHIWKPPTYPSELHPHLLKLLERFDVAFNMLGTDAKSDKAQSLIPAMLPRDCPQDIKTSLIRQLPTQYGRIYQMDFIPSGLFSRLMVRMLYITQAQPKLYWRDGIIVSKDDHYVQLELDHAQRSIRFTVRGIAVGAIADIIRVMIETIQSLLEHAFKGALVKVIIPCTHCLQDGNVSKSFHFGLDECERAMLDGRTTMVCGHSNTKVRTDQLVPDLSMSQTPSTQISKQDVEAIIAQGVIIGEGATAKVYRGQYRGETVACKVLNTVVDEEEVSHEDLSKTFGEFRRECWLMSAIDHPNIVRMHGLCVEPLSIMTEYLTDGDLHKYLAKQRGQAKEARIDWSLCLSLALDIARGMEHLHSLKPPVVHRDLKTPNVLLSRDQTPGRPQLVAKVSDFGLSGAQYSIAKKVVTNPIWLAPEVIKGGESTLANDVYAFGVILWELFTCGEFFGDQGAFIRFLD
ncbi:hypothetical protein SAMD00019534_096240 [Acytostelium subglobosum LB1]|uniref:hypothetical protein n=1 Tax=Acytostelium subglobosum LB1 TaxID=1410327 RepID=UPI000644AC16|nr:hypothetical protein SAMD00019534_096240 [Acytostelium subglobosum LB1]GAM26449.1 hypothetical protein SAMD00019534_096240 [Acytostelium subglobosum LB1]|eukprot:XP_012750545.1 hypothetical protein SAMD00019534_096240 [Acytostelium subglobosum LB1]